MPSTHPAIPSGTTSTAHHRIHIGLKSFFLSFSSTLFAITTFLQSLCVRFYHDILPTTKHTVSSTHLGLKKCWLRTGLPELHGDSGTSSSAASPPSLGPTVSEPGGVDNSSSSSDNATWCCSGSAAPSLPLPLHRLTTTTTSNTTLYENLPWLSRTTMAAGHFLRKVLSFASFGTRSKHDSKNGSKRPKSEGNSTAYSSDAGTFHLESFLDMSGPSTPCSRSSQSRTSSSSGSTSDSSCGSASSRSSSSAPHTPVEIDITWQPSSDLPYRSQRSPTNYEFKSSPRNHSYYNKPSSKIYTRRPSRADDDEIIQILPIHDREATSSPIIFNDPFVSARASYTPFETPSALEESQNTRVQSHIGGYSFTLSPAPRTVRTRRSCPTGSTIVGGAAPTPAPTGPRRNPKLALTLGEFLSTRKAAAPASAPAPPPTLPAPSESDSTMIIVPPSPSTRDCPSPLSMFTPITFSNTIQTTTASSTSHPKHNPASSLLLLSPPSSPKSRSSTRSCRSSSSRTRRDTASSTRSRSPSPSVTLKIGPTGRSHGVGGYYYAGYKRRGSGAPARAASPPPTLAPLPVPPRQRRMRAAATAATAAAPAAGRGHGRVDIGKQVVRPFEYPAPVYADIPSVVPRH